MSNDPYGTVIQKLTVIKSFEMSKTTTLVEVNLTIPLQCIQDIKKM